MSSLLHSTPNFLLLLLTAENHKARYAARFCVVFVLLVRRCPASQEQPTLQTNAAPRRSFNVGFDVFEKLTSYLHLHIVRVCIVFSGFGLFDNGLMIICGQRIDMTLVASFGINTMATAGVVTSQI